MALAAASPRPAVATAIATVLPPEGLFLRAAPGIQYQALDLAPGGTRVAVVGPENEAGWYPAVFKGKRGWMRGEFLEMGTEATVLVRRAAVRAPDGAGLFAEPNVTASRLAQLVTGMAVTVSMRTTTDGWVLVANNGLTGWVTAEQLAIEGVSAPLPAPAASPSGAAQLAPPVVPGTAVRGTITYYHPSLEGGAMACGGRYRAEDATIAAATSWPCGTRLKVCRNGNCVTVTVQDSGHMGPNWVDLSASAFRQLAPLADMLVTGTIEVLP